MSQDRYLPVPGRDAFVAASNAFVAGEPMLGGLGLNGSVEPSKRLLRTPRSGRLASGSKPGVESPAYPSPSWFLSAATKGGSCGGNK